MKINSTLQIEFVLLVFIFLYNPFNRPTSVLIYIQKTYINRRKENEKPF